MARLKSILLSALIITIFGCVGTTTTPKSNNTLSIEKDSDSSSYLANPSTTDSSLLKFFTPDSTEPDHQSTEALRQSKEALRKNREAYLAYYNKINEELNKNNIKMPTAEVIQENLDRECKLNPSSDFCKMRNRISNEAKNLKAGVVYSYSSENTFEIQKNIDEIILQKKIGSLKIHSRYANRSKVSISLTKKWNDIVNNLVLSESINNNYLTYYQNKKLFDELNVKIISNKVTVSRESGFYQISTKDKVFDEKINKIIKRSSNKDLFPISVSKERLKKLNNKAFVLAKAGYLKNAPLVARSYIKHKKNVYIISGTLEPPHTSNVFGNLYIHERHLNEIESSGMLNAVLYHEAMHIKDNLLGFDTSRRAADAFQYRKKLTNAMLGGRNKDFSKDLDGAGSYLKYISDSSMLGHSENLLRLSSRHSISPKELYESKLMLDILREINIDRKVFNYVSPKDIKNYVNGMVGKVSFNNRYRVMFSVNKNSYDLFNNYMIEFFSRKVFSNYNEIMGDSIISEDENYDHILSDI